MARLSFGLYEYDDYVSDADWDKYMRVGLGNAGYFKYITSFGYVYFLSTIIINILIAVTVMDMNFTKTITSSNVDEFFTI